MNEDRAPGRFRTSPNDYRRLSRLLRLTGVSQNSIVRAALMLTLAASRAKVEVALGALTAPPESFRASRLGCTYVLRREERAAANALAADLDVSLSAVMRAALVIAEDAEPAELTDGIRALPGATRRRYKTAA